MKKQFQAIFQLLFGNLHRQLVTITGSGLSKLHLLLIFQSSVQYIGRTFAILISLYYKKPIYYEYDVMNRKVYLHGRIKHKSLTFLVFFLVAFSMRLFYILYFNADQLVWSHLYDLAARNRKQLYLQLWSSASDQTSNQSWFSQFKTYFWPRLKVLKSAKLQLYPNLNENLRIKCALIYYVLEVLTTVTFALYVNFFFLHMYNILSEQEQSLSFAQILFAVVQFLTNIHCVFITYSLFFLIELILFLVCHVYVVLYRQVNSNLKKVKVKLLTAKGLHHLNSLSISQATSTYRAAHARLTVFILRYNSSIISKIIAAFLHYYLPYHAYRTVFIYFRRRDMPSNLLRNDSFSLAISWFFLMVLTFFLAKVNKKICSSGQTLGTIFARKGVLAAEIRSKQARRGWVNNLELIWGNEALKLASYYQMIWRSGNDKELAFTAGQMNTAMSWKFIVEVREFLKNIFF